MGEGVGERHIRLGKCRFLREFRWVVVSMSVVGVAL
jgi:hypothetical protein